MCAASIRVSGPSLLPSVPSPQPVSAPVILPVLAGNSPSLASRKIETYESPFSSRYGSDEMRAVFSPQTKFSTWRKIWVALAEAEKDLGLSITDEQIAEMKAHIDDIDLKRADEIEKKNKHDVMAHVETYGIACPKAKGIIHMGATSCLVTDNADVIVIREALQIVQKKLGVLIQALAEKADQYKDLPCLSYTHYQAAQPTTVGKRFALWLQDFLTDLTNLQEQTKIRCLGIKGATGTQASFLDLFDGDHDKVKQLEEKVMGKMGFEPNQIFPLASQTYSRKQDMQILSYLAGIAVSAQKMATDLRHLAHDKEVEEPFGAKQIGSSAMPYKRNPMENERICSLARLAISHSHTLEANAGAQWLERTLDDSANRRVAIPEAFLSIDAILDSLTQITNNCVIYPKMIERNLMAELPFMATENILMAAVKKGADRQIVHERLRILAQQAGDRVKKLGEENNLLELIAEDPQIGLTREELAKIVDVKKFVGRAPEQVTEFLNAMKKPKTSAENGLFSIFNRFRGCSRAWGRLF